MIILIAYDMINPTHALTFLTGNQLKAAIISTITISTDTKKCYACIHMQVFGNVRANAAIINTITDMYLPTKELIFFIEFIFVYKSIFSCPSVSKILIGYQVKPHPKSAFLRP